MKNSSRFLAAAVALACLPGTAWAATYHADSDTGVEALDYIENNRRAARANALTDEQRQLIKDAREMEAHLRHPLKTGDPVPVAFEGDDLSYDERTGEFTVKGHVNILQMDAHRFEADYVQGNTQKRQITVPGKAHILQMTEGQTRVTLDGYKADYNYGTHTGTLESARGKAGYHYITGKRFEFYPDHMVVYDGTETRCGAQKPDYHLKAKKITYYPNDHMELENVKFYIKGTPILSRKHYVTSVGDGGAARKLPRIGYNNDDGAWLEWDLDFPVRHNVNLNTDIYVTGHDGWRSNYTLSWKQLSSELGLTYGYYEDSDDIWIKKEPSVFWKYNHHIGATHFTYSLNTEYGRWYGNGVHSNHSEYGLGLGYDPIHFHRYKLTLGTGYGITRESFDDSRIDGMSFDAVLTKDFNDRWAAYTGYHYSKKNRENSLFDFDTDDYSKKLESGFSYRVDRLNRFVMGTRYDLDHSRWRNIDYYWFHDLHCSEFIVRYKSMTNAWSIRWQFTPW